MLGRKCGHTGRAPWGTIRCTKPAGHAGQQHSARGLKWGADGKVRVGGGRKGGSR